MIRNYLIIAYRKLIRNKVFSLINILGLAIGIAAVMLILLWVKYEVSYDKFHRNADQLFRVNSKDTVETDWEDVLTTSPFPLAPALFDKYPEIINYTRFWHFEVLAEYGDKSIYIDNGYMVDTGFFRMFDVDFIYGSLETALQDPYSAVLTESTAAMYFGDQNPVGETVRVDTYTIKVTAVVKDFPGNSHMQFDLLTHILHVPPERLNSWAFAGPSYVMISDKVTPEEVNEKIFGFYQTLDPETTMYPYLQNIKKIHLYEHGVPGRIRYVIIFTTVAILLLFIACINFINLSTARFSDRAKEIGIRKIVGSTKHQIAWQFFLESFITALIAGLIGFILIELIRPGFNALVNREIRIDYLKDLIFGLLPVVIFSGILSGIYPALFLSSFSPMTIFRGNLERKVKHTLLKPAMIVLQFTISIGLIISSLVIYKQLRYIQHKELGYDRQNVLVVPCNESIKAHFDSFTYDLRKSPGVAQVSASSLLPINVNWYVGLNWDKNKDNKPIGVYYIMAEYDYFETLDMEILYGRSFSRDHSQDDSISYIINEAALKAMGIQEPVGTTVHFDHPEFPERFRDGKIIGVVKDFHFRSLTDEITPFIIRMYRPWLNHVLVKLVPGKAEETLPFIESVYRSYAPQYPWEYSFMDDEFTGTYDSEQKMAKIILWFTLLSIFVSALGLFGLATFMAQKRTKEIGIRKVNGASIPGIIMLLTKDFTKYVIIGFIPAAIIAGILMTRWLQHYAYHTALSWWIFAAAGMMALIISALTVTYQAYRAASRNPVESLRYE